MPKKGKTKRDAQWAEAKRKCRLNAETLRMAKELGLNPRSLIKNIPNKAQPWKAPVHVWIREMYEKRQAKAAQRRATRGKRQAGNGDGTSADGNCAVEAKRQRDPVLRNHEPSEEHHQNEIPF